MIVVADFVSAHGVHGKFPHGDNIWYRIVCQFYLLEKELKHIFIFLGEGNYFYQMIQCLNVAMHLCIA